MRKDTEGLPMNNEENKDGVINKVFFYSLASVKRNENKKKRKVFLLKIAHLCLCVGKKLHNIDVWFKVYRTD